LFHLFWAWSISPSFEVTMATIICSIDFIHPLKICYIRQLRSNSLCPADVISIESVLLLSVNLAIIFKQNYEQFCQNISNRIYLPVMQFLSTRQYFTPNITCVTLYGFSEDLLSFLSLYYAYIGKNNFSAGLSQIDTQGFPHN
jgi:hypothetical protein